MKLGYARVSTIEQDLDMQIKKLEEQGIKKENIYIEKQSGMSKSN